MRLGLRRRSLNTTFRTYYDDLLKAIANDNYESLETLCEETLLVELAAKIYEYEKYKNVQFRVKDQSDPPSYDLQIINHFYVKNMSVQRKENPSLKDFKMLPTLNNIVEYVPKNRSSDVDHLDITVLETLEGMKRLYQVETAEQRARREAEEAQKAPP